LLVEHPFDRMALERRMAEKVFYSFHYEPDNWRASQVRNMGLVEGNRPVSDNDWESVTKGGDKAIENWIDEQLSGRTCAVVLIGRNTAGRKWINHEISRAWNLGKGVVGIHVHNLKDSSERQTSKGTNALDGVTFTNGGAKLSTVARTYDPPFTTSTSVYKYISDNLQKWVAEAISIRKNAG
jgi:hypothetical protein